MLVAELASLVCECGLLVMNPPELDNWLVTLAIFKLIDFLVEVLGVLLLIVVVALVVAVLISMIVVMLSVVAMVLVMIVNVFLVAKFKSNVLVLLTVDLS